MQCPVSTGSYLQIMGPPPTGYDQVSCFEKEILQGYGSSHDVSAYVTANPFSEPGPMSHAGQL